MKRMSWEVKRRFIGVSDNHLYVYAATGKDYPWIEVGSGRDNVTIESVKDAREVAALLLEWANKNDRPAKAKRRKGAT